MSQLRAKTAMGYTTKNRIGTFIATAKESLAAAGLKADYEQYYSVLSKAAHNNLRADYVIANPPFNDSEAALHGSAFLQNKAKMLVVSEAKDNVLQ